MREVHRAVKKFILENFLFASEEDAISGDTSFLDNGIVDSTGVLEIVEFVESAFGISVSDEEVVPDNFDSIDKITGYVNRKLADAGLIDA